MFKTVDYKTPGGMMAGKEMDDALYRLEERVYGSVLDDVHASDAPEQTKGDWERQAMAVLVEAQDAVVRGSFDAVAFTERVDAIADSARSFSAS